MEERTKDVPYYLGVLKKRKKLLIFPALAIFLITTAVALLLPSIYQSSSTVLIEEQQIPPDFVRSTVTGFADQRIQSLTQQILSRRKLIDIIKQLDLYSDMKEKYTQEEIVKKMHSDVSIDTISAEVGNRPGRKGSSQSAITIAFTISYRGNNPGTVQKVAGTLASLYLEQNIKLREAQAQSTTKFLEAELKGLEERIQTLGDKITKFKEEHEGMLPELQQFNLGQADRLESEIKQIDVNIRTAEERRVYLQGQIATVKQDKPAKEDRVDPATRLRALQVGLADLRAKFSEGHPDIKKVLREKAELEKMVGNKRGSEAVTKQKLDQLKMELAEKQGKYSEEHPDIRKLKKEIERLEKEPVTKGASKPTSEDEADNPSYINLLTQIQVAATEIESLQKQKANLKERLRMYRQRLEEAPKLEQEYLAYQRDYANAHQKHQEVMNKILEARISEGMEEHQKAEKFTLIDPASFPEKPIKPNRLMIILSGLIFGLISGVGAIALAENLDHSIKSADELAWITGLPVLGSICRIKTDEDVVWRHRKRRLIWAAIGFTLLMGVVLFHFIFMDLWVLTAKLLRLAHKYS